MTRSTATALALTLCFGTAIVALADVKGGEKDVSVTGEVIDTFCYGGMGAKGPSHKTCGIECAHKGIPVGLLEKGTDKIHILLPTKDKTALPESVVSKMGETVTVTGHAFDKGGVAFLTVESVK